jgi:hypothetical protein
MAEDKKDRPVEEQAFIYAAAGAATGLISLAAKILSKKSN